LGIRSETIRFSSASKGDGEGEIEGHLVLDASATEEAPGIVLIHEVFGLDAHMRSVARRFAEAGCHVLIPDLYSRAGVPGVASTEADPAPIWELETIREAVRELPDRRALADIDAAARVLSERPEVDGDRIAAIGFCMGGTLAFLSACTSRRFAGCVSFYGRVLYPELSAAKPIQPLELALNLDRPLLAFFGEKDEGISLEDVERLRTTLAAGAKNFEVVCYPEAKHGFFNNLRPNFDARAAEDAWERTLKFIEEDL